MKSRIIESKVSRNKEYYIMQPALCGWELNTHDEVKTSFYIKRNLASVYHSEIQLELDSYANKS